MFICEVLSVANFIILYYLNTPYVLFWKENEVVYLAALLFLSDDTALLSKSILESKFCEHKLNEYVNSSSHATCGIYFADNDNPLPHPARTSHIPPHCLISTACSVGESTANRTVLSWPRVFTCCWLPEAVSLVAGRRSRDISGPKPVYWRRTYLFCWRASLPPQCHASGNLFARHYVAPIH